MENKQGSNEKIAELPQGDASEEVYADKESGKVMSAAKAEETENAVLDRTAAKSRGRFFTTKNMVRMAVLTAVSYILYMFVKFPLPFMFPSWLDFQFSDLPALLGGFMMGPLAGGIIIVLKCLLKMPFTSTLCVGEIADIAVGLGFVLPSTFFYKYRRSKKGAAIGLAIGTAAATAVSLVMNAFVLIPFYVRVFFGGDTQVIVNMVGGLFPSVTWENFLMYYLPLSVLPFNLLRCLITALLTFLLYKGTERLFDRIVPQKKKSGKAARTD